MTVRLTVSSGREKPVTYHSVMSTFLPGLVQVLPMLTFLFQTGTSRCFFPSDLPSIAFVKNTAVCLMPPRNSIFYYSMVFMKHRHYDLFPFSVLININEYRACFFWIRHLNWKRFNSDCVMCHQGGLDLEGKVICFD